MIKKRGVPNNVIFSLKSQATIFIIMALVILLAGMIYFFYQKISAEKEIEVVPTEAAPVKLFVENCIKNVGDEGLDVIGLSGGYADLPAKIANDPRSYLSIFANGFKTPYWWHDGIDAAPSEEFVRQQLSSYVSSELKNCINNFESLAGKFEITEMKTPLVDVEFNENDVSFKVKYPIEIVSKDGLFKQLLQNFAYTSNIRFKKVFELATEIMERENKDFFLEKKTIDLMSMDTEIPITDVVATCNTKAWQLSRIKEKLQTLLRINLPYVRVEGTDFDDNLYVPNPSGKSIYSNTYFQHHYIWDIDKNSKKFSNMKVTFAYEDWPMQIYARPSENGVLKSNSNKGTELLSFLCIQMYHFTYDVGYPVIVSVIDQETSNNKPYRFNFAFKVSVDHNYPNRESRGTASFDFDEPLVEYCSELQNEITIYTVNNATGEDINDVNLTFVCGRDYCDMGKSEWISFGAAAGITKRFPYCVNGIIKGIKEGFADSKEFIQTDVDGRSYILFLNPIKRFRNYKVVKHQLSNPLDSQELSPGERASISIKGKDNGFESFAVYPKESESQIVIPDLKEGTYEVNIFVSDNDNIVGGYTGDWKIGKHDLTGADQIVFHAITQGPATEDERALFISGLSSYSRSVPAPELK